LAALHPHGRGDGRPRAGGSLAPLARSDGRARPLSGTLLEVTFGHRGVGPYGRRAVEEDFGDVTVLHGVIRDGVARDGVTARGVSPQGIAGQGVSPRGVALQGVALQSGDARGGAAGRLAVVEDAERGRVLRVHYPAGRDRKSTRLNSSHVKISYAVFC